MEILIDRIALCMASDGFKTQLNSTESSLFLFFSSSNKKCPTDY